MTLVKRSSGHRCAWPFTRQHVHGKGKLYATNSQGFNEEVFNLLESTLNIHSIRSEQENSLWERLVVPSDHQKSNSLQKDLCVGCLSVLNTSQSRFREDLNDLT